MVFQQFIPQSLKTLGPMNIVKIKNNYQNKRQLSGAFSCDCPRALSIDEPTSSSMTLEAYDLAREGNNLHELVADRIIFMDGGSIVEQNSPGMFFKKPQTARCKKFLKQILHH